MRRTRSLTSASMITAPALGVLLVLTAAPGAPADPPGRSPAAVAPVADGADGAGGTDARAYRVTGSSSRHLLTKADRDRIAATGVAIDAVEDARLDISATRAEVRRLRRLGYVVVADAPAGADRADRAGGASAQDFPAADAGFHNYAETVAGIDRVVAAFPALASKQVIGRSYEGRDIYAVKISDNVGADEDEPEVLLTHHQHAREHLTVEMALYEMNLLTTGYAGDATIKALVDSREIWIVPDVNPDGGEYDIATGRYRSWRKNRQPNAGSTNVGTDLNRNWGYGWGCCGGSSGATSSETYRGPSAFSAPETRVVRDFVASRVVGGVQQIRTHVDFHTYSELVLWPYGYTSADTAGGLSADDQRVFSTMGRAMAATNGYTAEQSSDLYVTDGSINDWMWATQRIWSFTFEMYPSASGREGFYPGDEVIARETARNRAALIYLLQSSACPYGVIGKPEMC